MRVRAREEEHMRAEITFYIHATPERVFAALSDHEHFFRGKDIKLSRVVSPGTTETNGLGAIREIHNGGVRFLETITHFDRPRRFDYLITKCSVPLRHEGGRITFTPRGDGTEIHWISDFEVRLPVIGGAAGGLFRLLLVDELTRLLHQAKRELESP
jgi:hypothetical protein